jgi:hypothetical protein
VSTTASSCTAPRRAKLTRQSKAPRQCWRSAVETTRGRSRIAGPSPSASALVKAGTRKRKRAMTGVSIFGGPCQAALRLIEQGASLPTGSLHAGGSFLQSCSLPRALRCREAECRTSKTRSRSPRSETRTKRKGEASQGERQQPKDGGTMNRGCRQQTRRNAANR